MWSLFWKEYTLAHLVVVSQTSIHWNTWLRVRLLLLQLKLYLQINSLLPLSCFLFTRRECFYVQPSVFFIAAVQIFAYYFRIDMERHSSRSVNSMSTQCQLQRNQIVYILNTVCCTFQLPVALICSHKEARHHERS